MVDIKFNVIDDKPRWVWEADDCKMFLSVMARCYSVFDLQYLSIPRIMGEKIAKYRDGMSFGKIDQHGGCVIETDAQARGLYPDKYAFKL